MATCGSDSTATSDEIIHIKCSPCAEENRKQEADKYCIDCKDYYCSSCVSVHKKIPIMKGHQVLDKADFKARGPDDSLPSYPVMRCEEHTTELLSIYCEDHDEVACAQCVAFSHRTCKKIISIPEEIDVLHRSVKPGDVKLKFRRISKTLEEIRTSKEAELKSLNEMFDKEVYSINELRQQLEELLDAAEKETIRELRKKYDTIRTALSDDIQTIDSLVKSLSESVAQLQKYEGNMSQEFVCAKCSEKLGVRAKDLRDYSQEKARCLVHVYTKSRYFAISWKTKEPRQGVRMQRESRVYYICNELVIQDDEEKRFRRKASKRHTYL